MTLLRRSFIGAVTAGFVLASGIAMAQPKGAVLVLGGTGQLGAEVVKILAAKGEQVTVFARPDSKRDLLDGLKVDYVTGDLMNDADVAAALKAKPYRAIINTVRVETGDIHFYEKIMGSIATHAKSTGVKQVIHQSAVGAGENAKNFPNMGWDKVPGLLDRLKDQGVGEDLLKKSGVTYTIIRNSRIWPAETPATGQAKLTEDQTVLTPMTRIDLAKLTVSCLDNTACANKIYHVEDKTLKWPPPRM
ncbi:MAG: NAD(P)H-binding protein [Rhodospirillaceae bacterium]|nr:NAD(P)H-binding protein [Rhodospirillaceae bacterium]